jgi:hypothetical protein
MEPAISCKFHCKRLQARWEGYWPATDPAALIADIEERLAAATAAWGLEGIEPLDGGVVALTCAATRHGRPVVLKLNPRGHSEDVQLAGEGDALALGPDRPSHDGGLSCDAGQGEAAAHRWLDHYAGAAEMDLGRAREWTRIRAGAEAR